VKELWNHFWSSQAFAVRIMRVLFIGLGTALLAGQLDGLIEIWPVLTVGILKTVGVLLNLAGSLLTGGANGVTKPGQPGT